MSTRDLIYELGCEDLPPMQIAPALSELVAALAKGLESLRIDHGDVEPYATPRRLALVVRGVAEKQRDLEETRVGPPVSAAYRDGELTKAGLGFMRSQGVEDTNDLFTVTQEKKKGKPADYLAVRVRQAGVRTETLLADVLQGLPQAIRWPKPMRWGPGEVAFARPVHWILAKFGEETIACDFAGVDSAGYTYGHRFHAPERFEVGASDYAEMLEKAKVLPSVEARRARILEVARRAAASVNGRIVEDEGLIDEIVHLVEWPVAIVGMFDEHYLELPREVLSTSMRKHQRYFTVVHPESGDPMPNFVTIANTEVADPAVVARGNLRVLRARLDDARFFFAMDQKKTLDEHAGSLSRVTWLEALGSVEEKVSRIKAVAMWLAERVGGDDALVRRVGRAAELCKADLATGMVYEFPELQGIMGGHYARAAGEDDRVAIAIADHYAPRGASDATPGTIEGALVSVADRIDSIAGLFSLGRIPTGAADPFALRRAAIGLVRIAFEHDLRVDLDALCNRAIAAVEGSAAKLGTDLTLQGPKLRAAMVEFVLTRLRGLELEEHATEVVDAVLAIGAEGGLEDLPAARARIEALDELRKTADFEPIAITFKRVGNILKDSSREEVGAVDPELFESDAERTLLEQSRDARGTYEGQLAERDFAAALGTLISLREPADRFFDDVLVNAEDMAVRKNRYALLFGVLELFTRYADVRQL